MSEAQELQVIESVPGTRRSYQRPLLRHLGSVRNLTNGSGGSIPDTFTKSPTGLRPKPGRPGT